MHSITSALLAVGLLSAGIATAEPCAKPADVAALDIASLKSRLMVSHHLSESSRDVTKPDECELEMHE